MNQYDKKNPDSIISMFGSIAKQYDRANAILSFNLHKRWNKKLVDTVTKKDAQAQYLDLCCGTGEIALNYLKDQKMGCTAYLLDFCPEMLHEAKDKLKKQKLNHHILCYLNADAQEIPLSDNSIDHITMAYGIRNIPDHSKVLKEIHRVLKPGGKVGILELTKPKNKWLKLSHSFYLSGVLPYMGRLVTSNKDAYQYLCNSIKAFTEPTDLADLFSKTGFEQTEIIPLAGGIATIVTAKK